MHPTIEATANQFDINTDQILKTVEDVDDSHQFVRPNDKANSINWNLGHITSTRFFIPTLLGSDIKCPFGEIYDQGKPILEDSAYPDLAEIKNFWGQASKELMERFQTADEAMLQASVPFKVPARELNVRGTIGFLLVHESYHFGQLAYIRRLLEYSPVFS